MIAASARALRAEIVQAEWLSECRELRSQSLSGFSSENGFCMGAITADHFAVARSDRNATISRRLRVLEITSINKTLFCEPELHRLRGEFVLALNRENQRLSIISERPPPRARTRCTRIGIASSAKAYRRLTLDDDRLKVFKDRQIVDLAAPPQIHIEVVHYRGETLQVRFNERALVSIGAYLYGGTGCSLPHYIVSYRQ
jgi:hypothetical protein